ncbi:MAG: carbohydrate kinase family protein [Anaerolineae bacterium]|nr:carbohydrate kinase family protein [Anaerolineae bacterium]
MTILVSGLINIETTLKIDRFPLEYNPVNYPFLGINSTVSGVGFNIVKALTTLGDNVHFISLIGQDSASQTVRLALQQDNIPDTYVLPLLEKTPQSVILYDSEGRRQIHVDLKDIQERQYPPEIYQQAAQNCDLAVLCNINFSRPFLAQAKQAGKIVATDVHTISDLNDSYNRDYMAQADILLMSHEKLPAAPQAWAAQVQNHFGTEIVVIGLGADGVQLAVKKDRFNERIPAVKIREIVNTIGAGDALFSAFIHFYHKTRDPYTAIRKAIVFAAYKIGTAGAAEGFVSEEVLETLYTHFCG